MDSSVGPSPDEDLSATPAPLGGCGPGEDGACSAPGGEASCPWAQVLSKDYVRERHQNPKGPGAAQGRLDGAHRELPLEVSSGQESQFWGVQENPTSLSVSEVGGCRDWASRMELGTLGVPAVQIPIGYPLAPQGPLPWLGFWVAGNTGLVSQNPAVAP